MFILNEMAPNKIIETIESLDNTLHYNSVELFEVAMKSIGLSVEKNKIFDDYSNHRCTGMLGISLIDLNFFKDEEKTDFKLLVKAYQKMEMVRHREDDLPATLEYDDDGRLLHSSYYLNGNEFRENKKPVFISYDYHQYPKQIIKYYRYFSSYDYNEENFTLYHVTFADNEHIIEGAFCYDNALVSYEEITNIMPEIKTLTLEQILNLKTIISKEHLSLIEMALI